MSAFVTSPSGRPADAVAAIDISCGELVAVTGDDIVGMRPCVASVDASGLRSRPERGADHRVWCSPDVDDLARAGAPGIVDEPWTLVDAPRVHVGGVALPFAEVAGATLHRAIRWLEQRIDVTSMDLRLVVPSNWGSVRMDKAERVAASLGLAPKPFRAALFMADALSSSYARWAYTVELSAKGAAVSLVHRQQRSLALLDTEFVLRVDPDDESFGVSGDVDLRVLAAVLRIRERHREVRHGSSEILVRGTGAESLVDVFDMASMPSYPVPARAVAEAAVSLPAAKRIGHGAGG